MIVVRIELWPGGNKSRAREIGVAHITNVGGSETSGTYKVELLKSPEYARTPGIWRRGSLSGFPRNRLGPWDLLLRALVAACGDRSRDAVVAAGDRIIGDAPVTTLEEEA